MQLGLALALALATLLGVTLAAPQAAQATEPVHPDLGPVRHRDPTGHHEVWLGVDVQGAAVPRRLGLYEDRVWTARVTGAWAFTFVPGLTLGGRHGVQWYDVTGSETAVRLRLHEHQLELSSSPLATTRRTRAQDRLWVGWQMHAVGHMRVSDVEVRPGGVRDTLAEVGYGMSHPLGLRWELGWRVAGRYAWVFLDTQQHAHAACRLSVFPGGGHVLSASAEGFYVYRDPEAAQRSVFGRSSVHGVFGAQYGWTSAAGVGPVVGGRFATHFGAGQTPIFETRQVAISGPYADATVGLRVMLP